MEDEKKFNKNKWEQWCNQDTILEKDNFICNVKKMNCKLGHQIRVWKLSTWEIMGPDPG